MRLQMIYSTITILILTLSVAVFAVSCSSLNIIEKGPEKIEWYYDSILFEVAAIQSATPDSAALSSFREKLHENRFCHRDRVKFLVHAPDYPAPPGTWNGVLISTFETTLRRFRDLDPDDRDLVVFVAYVDGFWLERGMLRFVGGLQYSETSFAIFKGGAGERESGVLLHEFGHLVGLVNENSPTYDDKHLRHCEDVECAMYWTTPEFGADFCEPCKFEISHKIRKRNLKRKAK